VNDGRIAKKFAPLRNFSAGPALAVAHPHHCVPDERERLLRWCLEEFT
jgi:hypothetical protein